MVEPKSGFGRGCAKGAEGRTRPTPVNRARSSSPGRDSPPSRPPLEPPLPKGEASTSAVHAQREPRFARWWPQSAWLSGKGGCGRARKGAVAPTAINSCQQVEPYLRFATSWPLGVLVGANSNVFATVTRSKDRDVQTKRRTWGARVARRLTLRSKNETARGGLVTIRPQQRGRKWSPTATVLVDDDRTLTEGSNVTLSQAAGGPLTRPRPANKERMAV